jgi:hypothetical protein
MSIYEQMDYDDLQRRIGLVPVGPDGGWTWHCGDNPAPEAILDEPGATYNDADMAYAGRNPKMAGGFCLSEDVNVNGLLLNHRDKNNTLWICTEIEGWWTTPPAEIPDVAKPFWDGSLLTTGRYGVRTITISGIFIPPDPSLVWYNRDAILRAAGIVRGVGLLAMCGNESPSNPRMLIGADNKAIPNKFYDPPKMTLIQTADVPLVRTLKTTGLTEFSLSFRAMNPAKLAVYEKSETLPIESTSVVRERRYRAISLSTSEGGGETTEYRELQEVTGSSTKRHYSGVRKVNLDTPIEDEEWFNSQQFDPASYQTTAASKIKVLNNAGNYFSFPTFVFDSITSASTSKPVIIRNMTTNEEMHIVKSVPTDNQLVIDCGLRRVGQVDPEASVTSWRWDDRNFLTLDSQWITLAPGVNTLVLSKDDTVKVPILPKIYWRDAWTG